jgi:hypothetical protein
MRPSSNCSNEALNRVVVRASVSVALTSEKYEIFESRISGNATPLVKVESMVESFGESIEAGQSSAQ